MCILFIASIGVMNCAYADDVDSGAVVVTENENCPDGMVVSGLSGGEGAVSKVCVRPNSDTMPSDDTDYGDPSSEEHENPGV
jgi:hypothetical protein